MIKVKTINDPINKLDGRRVLITTYRPKDLETRKPISWSRLDIKDWMYELAPSPTLVQRLKAKEIDKKQFMELYKTELYGPLKVDKTTHCLNTLKAMEFFDDNGIVLVTFPKDMHGEYVKSLVEATKTKALIKGEVVEV